MGCAYKAVFLFLEDRRRIHSLAVVDDEVGGGGFSLSLNSSS